MHANTPSVTACATVADLLAITPNPARMSLDAIRHALHVGTDRARAIRALAMEQVQRQALNPHRLSESEADAARALGVL